MKDRVVGISYGVVYLLGIVVAGLLIFNLNTLEFIQSFQWSEFSLKAIILTVANLCATLGLAWVAIPYCLSRIYDIVGSATQGLVLESMRQSIMYPFKLSKTDIVNMLRHGDSVYLEDLDDDICCLVTQGDTNKIGVVKRLPDESLDQFSCEDVADEIVAMYLEGVGVYDTKVLKELSECGYELTSG